MFVVAQPKRAKSRKRKRKPPRRQAAYRRNRRNARGRRLQRLRSEKVERTFAHVLETGESRRTWLRGLAKIRKRYLFAAVAYNLDRILRQLLGVGNPIQFGDLQAAFSAAFRLFRSAYLVPESRRAITRIAIALQLPLLMPRKSATF